MAFQNWLQNLKESSPSSLGLYTLHSLEGKAHHLWGQLWTLWLMRRPWEAPENLLADAGVELGVNYPLPVISIEESEHALSQAMAAIQQSLVEDNDKVSACTHSMQLRSQRPAGLLALQLPHA